MRGTGVFDDNDVEVREGDVILSEIGTHHLIVWDEERQLFVAPLLNYMDERSREILRDVLGDEALSPTPFAELLGGSFGFEIVNPPDSDSDKTGD